MPTLHGTIRCWADGQNALDALSAERQAALRPAIERVIERLRRLPSLGDLAAAYFDDGHWWPRLAEEHGVPAPDAGTVRDAAYWQRFMEIRHPEVRRTFRPPRAGDVPEPVSWPARD